MKLATAAMALLALLAQTALCDRVLHAREAKVTPAPAPAAAVLLAGRQAQKDECREGKTACGDGNGCCPRGAQCTQSKGVGVCADACEGATLFCNFGGGVTLCCQPGASCDYARSVCTQQKTDAGGVWTAASTTTSEEGTRLPTAPAFSSTEDPVAPRSTTTTTMIEFDPDRVPPIKLGLHIAQIVLAFVLWVLEIVVFTGKGSKVVGNNGWTFAAFFISIPIWLFLIMTPRFERTRRFANVHAMFAVDIFGIILWLSAFATQAAYNSSGLCGNRCGISKGVVAIGVIITLLFGGSTFISGYTMTYYKFHGSLPGYSNRKIRGGSNDIDPDKEAFSMAPHGDEAYERVHMDDHDHDGPSAGAGSYSNRYGTDPNPYSGGHYEEEDPNRYGAVPPRGNAGAFFDSETQYHSGGGAGSPPPVVPAASPYRPPAVEDVPVHFPPANYDRVDR
ncbi:hypothetical protein MY5147_004233 [Beauveria neobassiana]